MHLVLHSIRSPLSAVKCFQNPDHMYDSVSRLGLRVHAELLSDNLRQIVFL